MDLDPQVCSRARLSRDPRFDGKFFIGVKGSGVYCRSICPAPTAQEKNCRYFATAAAAAEAGFRPCLRCRPESSPGTPAWLGTSNTVSRALRLISETGLEEGGVEALAERLGIGSRHLRRLFLQHLGATPMAVARTRRLHFAKKLIDETSLTMNQISVASGFGSVRRFNAGIRKFYHRTPSQMRRVARQRETQPANRYVLRLNFRPPYHWQGMLDFLTPRCTHGVEAVEADTYRRTISVNGDTGYFEVCPDREHHWLVARIEFGDPQALFGIAERIRRMFDLNADWSSIAATLESDPLLASLVQTEPGLRVPGCWDGFELTVRAILGQQITVKAATTLAGRLVERFGKKFDGPQGLTHQFPEASALADAQLSSIGVTGSRAHSIRSLARAVCDATIGFTGVIDSAEFLSHLCDIPGIGNWTAQYVAMRALGEPDAFPSTDLGLLRATSLRNAQLLERRTEIWRPWRAYAAMYLWRFGAKQTVRSKKQGTVEVRLQKGEDALSEDWCSSP
jgi:AraC family transcriptional regulator, regulatory protein of adaptative response / DNA-3-methyladenine glycosylase II